ncbi:hypothetical protein B0H13DRAFT_1926871, partial [Mycena leptocephala]
LLHSPASIGISEATAGDVLYHGYTKGFSALFIMNACMTVCATLVSVLLIKHKELGRGDEEALREKAMAEEQKTGVATPSDSVPAPRDLEAGDGTAGADSEMATLSKGSPNDGAV